ncbi:hypothetical protein [Dolichospermum sp. UHCC 0259]|uniref:hypothetical protein n=1 Tax=Dolichospermum sp. UHCC 0259 TaxID=2590010 RepID=UPI001444DA93|nr:hypothetical protein [Dolichospermum sp. UHCC 0259]MTJ47326.1 hypothetical protein [Dolichospermum sp. UHCC 0259]
MKSIFTIISTSLYQNHKIKSDTFGELCYRTPSYLHQTAIALQTPYIQKPSHFQTITKKRSLLEAIPSLTINL